MRNSTTRMTRRSVDHHHSCFLTQTIALKCIWFNKITYAYLSIIAIRRGTIDSELLHRVFCIDLNWLYGMTPALQKNRARLISWPDVRTKCKYHQSCFLNGSLLIYDNLALYFTAPRLSSRAEGISDIKAKSFRPKKSIHYCYVNAHSPVCDDCHVKTQYLLRFLDRRHAAKLSCHRVSGV